MEQKKLSEKESLELITQMIQESRERIARHAAYPLLIWGYMTLLLSLVMWYVIERYAYWTIQFIWFLLPVICYPATLYFSRKDRSEGGTRNYMERITGQLWTVFGVVALLLSLFSYYPTLQGKINIYFYIPLLMGMGCTLTGLVNKHKASTWCGAIGTLLSFGILLIGSHHGLLLFGAIFAEMMIIPGHLLNRELKAKCSKS